MEFVNVRPAYWKIILEMRNDPDVRKACFDTNVISWDDHKKYMKRFEEEKEWHHWIVAVDNHIIGYTKLINRDFGYMIDRRYRGKGYGSQIYQKMFEKCHDMGISWIRALIRTDQQIPLIVAEKNGLSITNIEQRNESDYYVLLREGIC